jgi:hypothetical protein
MKTWEIALGRWLAVCAHPVCAWRARSTRVRLVVVMSYFSAGYIGVIAALLTFAGQG